MVLIPGQNGFAMLQASLVLHRLVEGEVMLDDNEASSAVTLAAAAPLGLLGSAGQ